MEIKHERESREIKHHLLSVLAPSLFNRFALEHKFIQTFTELMRNDKPCYICKQIVRVPNNTQNIADSP